MKNLRKHLKDKDSAVEVSNLPESIVQRIFIRDLVSKETVCCVVEIAIVCLVVQ